MTEAYEAAAWTPFYQAVVAAAAALLGLLFVSVSLNVAVVVDSPQHRARAREALGQLLVLVIVGVLVLIPGQSGRILGAELLALGVIVTGVTLRLQANTVSRLPARERPRWFVRDAGLSIGVLALPVAGLGLLLRGLGGLYWLVLATLIFFAWASLNAWSLLIGPRQDDGHGRGPRGS